jgi:hypothetical protein
VSEVTAKPDVVSDGPAASKQAGHRCSSPSDAVASAAGSAALLDQGRRRNEAAAASSSVSTHEIARRLDLARSTVRETLKRVDGAGLSWPLPEEINDEALEAALYASRRNKRGHRQIEEPDWAGAHHELKRKHVALLILWDEYIAANPGGYSYSRSASFIDPSRRHCR